MQQDRRQHRNETATKRRRRDHTARKNVVSLRISDQEKRILEGISQSSSRNVSDVVREAIEFWLTSRPGPQES